MTNRRDFDKYRVLGDYSIQFQPFLMGENEMRTASRIIVVACVLVSPCGCSSVKPVQPVSIDEGKICVSSEYLDKNVVFVEILIKSKTAHSKRVPMITAKTTLVDEMEDPGPFTIVWAIKAESPVPAKALQIVPGVVPQDFHQVVPCPSERFMPHIGQEYYVVMKLEPVDETFYAMGYAWTP